MTNSDINFKTEKFVIDDFSKTAFKENKIKSTIEPRVLYNFKYSNGILEKGMGIRELRTHIYNDNDTDEYLVDCSNLNLEYINKVMYFKQYFTSSGNTTHRLLIHGSDSKLYLFQMFSGVLKPNWVYELQFDSIPAVLEYKKDGLDSILISANDKLVVWSTGRTPYELSNIPTITSMCVYNDVLYCTIAGENDKIWYTENLNPESVGTESDKTKFLIMEGSAGGGKKIVVVNENVYVFCDYGIGRINTYAKQDATYNEIYLTNGKIYPNTVVVCGDFVIFMTQDGLYKFNGSSVTKIDVFQHLLENSYNEYSVATCLRSDYYLATNIDFGNHYVEGCESYEHKNNALIKLNVYDNSFEIMRGVDIKDMLALKAGVEEKVVLTFNSQYKNYIGEIVDDGMCFGSVIDRRVSTGTIMRDDHKPITIRKVRIDSSKSVSLVILHDGKMDAFEVLDEGFNEFQTVIQCDKFEIELATGIADAYVNFIEIEYVVQK